MSESMRAWYARQQMRGRRWMRSWHNRISILIPLVVLVFLTVLRFDALSAMLRRWWVTWQVRSAKAARSNPHLASKLYAELLRMLARRGLIREVSQTPLEFAAAWRRRIWRRRSGVYAALRTHSLRRRALRYHTITPIA